MRTIRVKHHPVIVSGVSQKIPLYEKSLSLLNEFSAEAFFYSRINTLSMHSSLSLSGFKACGEKFGMRISFSI